MRWLALASLVACAGAPDPDPAEPRALETASGAYLVEITPEPDPPPFSEPFDIEVHVGDAASGGPVDLPVAVGAWMNGPGHDHGMNVEPTVAPAGEPGLWLTSGWILHMTGTWDLTVTVDPDGAADEAVFAIECCEPPA